MDPADNEANIKWVKDYYAAIHPHSGSDGGYVNFMSSDDDHRAPANYGANYERLAAVKATYDPDNRGVVEPVFPCRHGVELAGSNPGVRLAQVKIPQQARRRARAPSPRWPRESPGRPTSGSRRPYVPCAETT